MKKPLYIILEGVDGSGKGTQVELLVEKLKKLGREVVYVREPGGTPMGEEIRRLLKSPEIAREPETEVFLFSAARAELVRRVISPALKRGAIVVSDRAFLSTVAYQVAGHKRKDLLPMVTTLTKLAMAGAKPDFVIILDLPTKVSLQRASKRNGNEKDRFDARENAFHERVRKGYLEAAKKFPHAIVKATGTVGEIEQCIWKELLKRFPKYLIH